jgi:competence protein ComGC
MDVLKTPPKPLTSNIMNTYTRFTKKSKGVTLLEMTIVILVLLTLLGVGMMSNKKIGEWKLGRQASETLRSVYSAQRMFLADHPTTLVSKITANDLIPYLPNNATAMPTVESLEGKQLDFVVDVSPPVVNAGNGITYDPSGNSTDSLWDVGQ